MLFSCLHLPPLPAVMLRMERDEDRVTGDDVESSHTLIGNLIEWVGLAKDQRLNGQRMLEQFAVLSRFRQDVCKLDLDTCSDEALYEMYCHHTRLWLDCYTKAGGSARFKPLEYVANGDKIHRNMVDYCKAQYHHFTEGGGELKLEPTVSYRELMRRCARWTQEAYREDGGKPPVEELD